MLRLLEVHCIPILTYASEVVHVEDRDYRKILRVAFGSIYRKRFGCGYRKSVTELQHCLNRPTWEELLDKRKAALLQKFPKLPACSLVRALSSYAYVLVGWIVLFFFSFKLYYLLNCTEYLFDWMLPIYLIYLIECYLFNCTTLMCE